MANNQTSMYGFTHPIPKGWKDASFWTMNPPKKITSITWTCNLMELAVSFYPDEKVCRDEFKNCRVTVCSPTPVHPPKGKKTKNKEHREAISEALHNFYSTGINEEDSTSLLDLKHSTEDSAVETPNNLGHIWIHDDDHALAESATILAACSFGVVYNNNRRRPQSVLVRHLQVAEKWKETELRGKKMRFSTLLLASIDVMFAKQWPPKSMMLVLLKHEESDLHRFFVEHGFAQVEDQASREKAIMDGSPHSSEGNGHWVPYELTIPILLAKPPRLSKNALLLLPSPPDKTVTDRLRSHLLANHSFFLGNALSPTAVIEQHLLKSVVQYQVGQDYYLEDTKGSEGAHKFYRIAEKVPIDSKSSGFKPTKVMSSVERAESSGCTCSVPLARAAFLKLYRDQSRSIMSCPLDIADKPSAATKTSSGWSWKDFLGFVQQSMYPGMPPDTLAKLFVSMISLIGKLPCNHPFWDNFAEDSPLTALYRQVAPPKKQTTKVPGQQLPQMYTQLGATLLQQLGNEGAKSTMIDCAKLELLSIVTGARGLVFSTTASASGLDRTDGNETIDLRVALEVMGGLSAIQSPTGKEESPTGKEAIRRALCGAITECAAIIPVLFVIEEGEAKGKQNQCLLPIHISQEGRKLAKHWLLDVSEVPVGSGYNATSEKDKWGSSAWCCAKANCKVKSVSISSAPSGWSIECAHCSKWAHVFCIAQHETVNEGVCLACQEKGESDNKDDMEEEAESDNKDDMEQEANGTDNKENKEDITATQGKGSSKGRSQQAPGKDNMELGAPEETGDSSPTSEGESDEESSALEVDMDRSEPPSESDEESSALEVDLDPSEPPSDVQLRIDNFDQVYRSHKSFNYKKNRRFNDDDIEFPEAPFYGEGLTVGISQCCAEQYCKNKWKPVTEGGQVEYRCFTCHGRMHGPEHARETIKMRNTIGCKDKPGTTWECGTASAWNGEPILVDGTLDSTSKFCFNCNKCLLTSSKQKQYKCALGKECMVRNDLRNFWHQILVRTCMACIVCKQHYHETCAAGQDVAFTCRNCGDKARQRASGLAGAEDFSKRMGKLVESTTTRTTNNDDVESGVQEDFDAFQLKHQRMIKQLDAQIKRLKNIPVAKRKRGHKAQLNEATANKRKLVSLCISSPIAWDTVLHQPDSVKQIKFDAEGDQIGFFVKLSDAAMKRLNLTQEDEESHQWHWVKEDWVKHHFPADIVDAVILQAEGLINVVGDEPVSKGGKKFDYRVQKIEYRAKKVVGKKKQRHNPDCLPTSGTYHVTSMRKSSKNDRRHWKQYTDTRKLSVQELVALFGRETAEELMWKVHQQYPATFVEGDSLAEWSIDPAHQVSKLRYSQETRSFTGRIYMSDDKSRYYDDVLETSWVNAQFPEQFVREVADCARYVDVPAGWCRDIKSPQDPKGELSMRPPIEYRQNKEETTCMPYSLASAMAFLGFKVTAEDLAQCAPNVVGRELARQFKEIIECVQKRKGRWRAKKVAAGLDLLDYRNLTVNPRLVVLRATDSSREHAVTICGGYIFETNRHAAVPLTREWLNWCVDGIYSGIYDGREFYTEKPMIKKDLAACVPPELHLKANLFGSS